MPAFCTFLLPFLSSLGKHVITQTNYDSGTKGYLLADYFTWLNRKRIFLNIVHIFIPAFLSHYFLKFREQRGAKEIKFKFPEIYLWFHCTLHTTVVNYLPTYFQLKAKHYHLPCIGHCKVPPSLKILELRVWSSGARSNCWYQLKSKLEKQQTSDWISNQYI